MDVITLVYQEIDWLIRMLSAEPVHQLDVGTWSPPLGTRQATP
jgi:hypothetical protein